ncbi:MAG: M6 family metalloprotease domain-containing protein, partial [Promethearchaeota archaeon]
MNIKIPHVKVKHRFVCLILLVFVYSIGPLMFLDLRSSSTQNYQSEIYSDFVSSRLGTNDPSPSSSLFGSFDAIGTHTILVILVEFTDEEHMFTPAEVSNVAIGDLNDYYQEASYGLTTVTGATTTWIQLGHLREYYVDRLDGTSDPKFKLVQDALYAADSQVNYNDYDGVTIVHAGQGQEISHDWKDYWSCEWWSTGPPFAVYDGKAIYRASVSPEEGAAGSASFVGVIAHEFGHDLGLPDLYDVNYVTEFVGDWCLMAKGSWNGPSSVGESPAHMMGWCKMELGYVNGSQIADASSSFIGTVDVLEQATTGVHIVKIPVTSQQYYLIEVRQQTGYDQYLPEKGVLLTYVDESLDSGEGIVKVIDAHPSTATKNDGAFDLGAGEVDTYISSHGQFTMILDGKVGNSYDITLLRAYVQFDNPLDGSAILTPNFTISWTGSAAAPGIDHYELYLDDVLSYTGSSTSHAVTGASAGLHNATLVMELVDGGKRLTIQSLFVVDLVAPTIQTVTHTPPTPGFGDLIQIILTATDDTWIVNASVFYRRGTDPLWYQIDMVNFAGSEWRGYLGTFLPGVVVTYYVSVTDAGGRTASDDNAGEYYTFTVSGLGLIIWLIIGGIAILIICLGFARLRKKSST